MSKPIRFELYVEGEVLTLMIGDNCFEYKGNDASIVMEETIRTIGLKGVKKNGHVVGLMSMRNRYVSREEIERQDDESG